MCVLSAGECHTRACLAPVAYLAVHLGAALAVSLSASRSVVNDLSDGLNVS